jgi:hypothetical protein
MMDGDATDLLERFLDDSIDAAGATALVKCLDADPEFRSEFCAALRLHGLLHASLDRDTACERLAEVVSIAIKSGDRSFDSRVMDGIKARGLPAPPRRRFLYGAAAAAALVALTLGLLLGRGPGDMVLSAAGPETGAATAGSTSRATFISSRAMRSRPRRRAGRPSVTPTAPRWRSARTRRSSSKPARASVSAWRRDL